MYSAIPQCRRRVPNPAPVLLKHGLIACRDGKYGLFLDDVFENGISSRCPAFGNEPLSGSSDKFKIDGVEVWRIGGSGGPTGFVYG